jgi:hypothetical protein
VVQNIDCCFELFGFDIIVDNCYKPWLLEVNMPPALAIDHPIDEMIKPNLIKDIVNLVQFEPYEQYMVRELVLNLKEKQIKNIPKRSFTFSGVPSNQRRTPRRISGSGMKSILILRN